LVISLCRHSYLCLKSCCRLAADYRHLADPSMGWSKHLCHRPFLSGDSSANAVRYSNLMRGNLPKYQCRQHPNLNLASRYIVKLLSLTCLPQFVSRPVLAPMPPPNFDADIPERSKRAFSLARSWFKRRNVSL